MADYIPRENLQTYTRWQADDFGAPRPAAPDKAAVPEDDAAQANAPPTASQEAEIVPAEQVRLPTAEDLERMHEDARQSGYQAGYDAGYQAGHEEGRQAGSSDAEAYKAEIGNLCLGLNEALQHFDQDMAESVLACALEVAGQLTRTIIRVQPETLLPTIREALALLPLHHGPVTLLIAPAEMAMVREHLETQFSQNGWQIQADPDIAPGGCRLRAGSSEVDATLNTRWRRTLESIGVTQEWLAGGQLSGDSKDRRKNE
ncbi:MAG: flagellar assembly protein FliH [Zoogloeaceae bacterium]|jgi:flagellar assembly protein FliH|nr:flagellar assembly protein FliH [Zoogloeaceae bacterium]